MITTTVEAKNLAYYIVRRDEENYVLYSNISKSDSRSGPRASAMLMTPVGHFGVLDQAIFDDLYDNKAVVYDIDEAAYIYFPDSEVLLNIVPSPSFSVTKEVSRLKSLKAQAEDPQGEEHDSRIDEGEYSDSHSDPIIHSKERGIFGLVGAGLLQALICAFAGQYLQKSR